jgi:uncharacterized sodium:solute symporter family permease YidK
MDGCFYVNYSREIFFTHFIEKGIYTIPEFAGKRFSTNLKTILAFLIALYVLLTLLQFFVSGLAIETIGVDMMYAIIGLALLQQLIHCMADYLLWLGLMLFGILGVGWFGHDVFGLKHRF